MPSPSDNNNTGAGSPWETAGYILIVVVVALVVGMCFLCANRKARASAHDIEMGAMRNKLQEAAKTTEEHSSAFQTMEVYLQDTLQHVAYRARMEKIMNTQVIQLQRKVDSLQAANRALTGQDDFHENDSRAGDHGPIDINSRSVIADIVLAQGPAGAAHGAPRSLEDELAAAEFGEYLEDPFAVGGEIYSSTECLPDDCDIDDSVSDVSTLHGDEIRIEPDSDSVSVLSQYHRNSAVVEEFQPVTIAHAQAHAIVSKACETSMTGLDGQAKGSNAEGREPEHEVDVLGEEYGQNRHDDRVPCPVAVVVSVQLLVVPHELQRPHKPRRKGQDEEEDGPSCGGAIVAALALVGHTKHWSVQRPMPMQGAGAWSDGKSVGRQLCRGLSG
ncbi:hypothetical protein PspLS_00973 [Pyricularia sp. CBS 133598]|nr:hypothetical protein PspLS_00973 [Pyricularia sp. CBS 133598]